MRILFIEFSMPYLLRDSDYPVGGWSVEAATWAREISLAGHDVAVLTFKGGKEYAGSQAIEFIDTYDPTAGVPGFKYAYSYLPKLVRAAREWHPDILIQGTRGFQSFMTAIAGGLIDVPFVHRIASDADVDVRFKDGLRRYEQVGYRYALRQASAILCQNSYQQHQLAKRLPATPLSIIRNPLPVPPSPFCRPRQERKYIAWLGNFRYPKNLPLLYEIAKKLPQIPFAVGGIASTDMDLGTARALEGLAALSNVKLLGYIRRTDVKAFFEDAVLLLSTSRYEGFSNAYLEALAAGTPIITRRAADPDYVVSKRELGVSVEEDTSLASAILRTWHLSPLEYAHLAARCREYAIAEHGPEDRVRELIAALSPVVCRKPDSKICGKASR